jgi:PadR family transcriptional regulator PadR
MRRKPGQLVPLERSILEASAALRGMGMVEAHGFLLARTIADQTGAKHLTAYGSLYKALDRLERATLLTSRWEDPREAADAGRPRRRFYRLTTAGEAALADARGTDPAVVRDAQPERSPVA